MKTQKHTEDCLDANDDTSVLKGECICPKEVTHTPTPWHKLLAPTQIVTDTRIIATVNHDGLEKHEGYSNAEFIVRAVNSHEELLAALKHDHETLAIYRKCPGFDKSCSVCQLIAKAEGK